MRGLALAAVVLVSACGRDAPSGWPAWRLPWTGRWVGRGGRGSPVDPVGDVPGAAGPRGRSGRSGPRCPRRVHPPEPCGHRARGSWTGCRWGAASMRHWGRSPGRPELEPLCPLRRRAARERPRIRSRSKAADGAPCESYPERDVPPRPRCRCPRRCLRARGGHRSVDRAGCHVGLDFVQLDHRDVVGLVYLDRWHGGQLGQQ